MTASGTVLELESVPSPVRLYSTLARRTAGAATVGRVLGSQRPSTLPNTTLRVRGVTPDPERLTAYQHLFGDTAGDVLPPGFVHVQAFPLHVRLMAFDDFPFEAAGLVHIANLVEQSEAIPLGAALDLRASVVRLRAHPKGTAFDFVTEVCLAGAESPVWHGTSTYLARGTSPSSITPSADPSRGAERRDNRLGGGEPLPDYPTALWRLGGDTGRRYASVSGDVNPIHLSRLTARAFGFHHAIAHGMYTAARALASVPRRLDAPLRWEVSFGAPVYLPSTVALAIAAAPTGPRTGPRAGPRTGPGKQPKGPDASPARGVVWSPRSGRVHLRFSAGQLSAGQLSTGRLSTGQLSTGQLSAGQG